MRKPFSTLIMSVIIGILVSMSFAYASQAEDPSKRGDGVGQVSGVNVSNIHYLMLSSDPTRVSAIEFEVADFQGTISVKLDSSTSGYYNCALESGIQWRCNVNNMSISNIDEVRVVARGN